MRIIKYKSVKKTLNMAIDKILGVYEDINCEIDAAYKDTDNKWIFISKEVTPSYNVVYLKCVCIHLDSKKEEVLVIEFDINEIDELYYDKEKDIFNLIYIIDNIKITEVKNNELYWAKVKPDAIIPTKDKENAGYDIYACFEEDFIVLNPHETRLIPTGIAAAVSPNYYLQVQERGSTGSKGMKYGAGVIDSSYRGEIFISITNTNDDIVIISKLNEQELIDKYAVDVDDSILKYKQIKYGGDIFDTIDLWECDDYKLDCKHFYPYSKAIAQLIVHDVHEMDEKEISYEELMLIPSKRGTGALGSSGK